MPYANREARLRNSQRWYQRNKALVLKRVGERNRRVVSEVKQKLRDYKEARGCADCGRRYSYYVMEFDHVRGHNTSPTRNMHGLVTKAVSWERILKEIEKCDLVCANCHRVRTHKRRLS